MNVHTSFGSGSPNKIPLFIGSHYVDTVNKKAYVAVGVQSLSDWKINASRPFVPVVNNLSFINGGGYFFLSIPDNTDTAIINLTVADNHQSRNVNLPGPANRATTSFMRLQFKSEIGVGITPNNVGLIGGDSSGISLNGSSYSNFQTAYTSSNDFYLCVPNKEANIWTIERIVTSVGLT